MKRKKNSRHPDEGAVGGHKGNDLKAGNGLEPIAGNLSTEKAAEKEKRWRVPEEHR